MVRHGCYTRPVSVSAKSSVTPEGALVTALLLLLIYMQSAVGRGPGAALGVVAIALVAVGTWAATRLASRSGSALFRV